jgi:hypothetical protein
VDFLLTSKMDKNFKSGREGGARPVRSASSDLAATGGGVELDRLAPRGALIGVRLLQNDRVVHIVANADVT